MIYRTNLRVEAAEQTVRKLALGICLVVLSAVMILVGVGAELRERSRLVEREAEVYRLQTGECRDLVHYYTIDDHDYVCPNPRHVLHHEGSHVECKCK